MAWRPTCKRSWRLGSDPALTPRPTSSGWPAIASAPVDRVSFDRQRDQRGWRRWYKTARWQRLRMSILRRDLFTCQWPGCGRVEAATAIGVSVPTLRKHYFSEVAKRDAAALRFEMVQLHRLNEGAKGGSVAAEKELARRLDKLRVDKLSDEVSRGARPPRPPVIGKKEAAQQAANDLRGPYEAPPPPPGLLN